MVLKTKFILSPDQQPLRRHSDSPERPEPDVATDELVRAVNLAIYLRRPLLLEGDAGCGKTRLARHVAYELGLPLYEWHIRSTSKAQEGFYTYDSILRLHDVYMRQLDVQTPQASAKPGEQTSQRRDPQNPKHYRKFGVLGKAFELRDCPAVVLIDEIDKADMDFPNDLLTVLDDPWTFVIHETYEKIVASHKPIMIITSNKEKGDLPAPFLRRCIYFYLNFPDNPERLKQIVNAHYELREADPPSSELVDSASNRFLEIRRRGDLIKKPGTSEYLDWLESLRSFEDTPYEAELLKNNDDRLPYPELLFKLKADWQRYAMLP